MTGDGIHALRAYTLSPETQQPRKIILAPRSSRAIAIITDELPEGWGLVLQHHDIALQSIFVPGVAVLNPHEHELVMYNGGHQSFFIEHGRLLAWIHYKPTFPMSASSSPLTQGTSSMMPTSPAPTRK